MITFHMGDVERLAKSLRAAQDQIPYAASLALNEAAYRAKQRLAEETWPRHVKVRNRSFMRAALDVERSNKRDLRVTIFDRLGRGNLDLHDRGGTAVSKSGRFAIPTSRVRKGAKGVIQSQRPANLKRKVVRGGLIFQAVGKGNNQRLELMFKLQPSNRIKPDVPLRRDGKRFMREEMRRTLPKAIKKAMSTRR